jgi:hypothetical protein
VSEDFKHIASAQVMSNPQRLFVRYFTAILVDLTVLNLFAEYWSHVIISSFAISLFAATLLQALLQLTLKLEHRVAEYFNSKPGKAARFMRFFSAWLILFLSKFVILGAVDFCFGHSIQFEGPLHGVVAFIVVVFAMLGAEEVIMRIYRRLA